MMKNKVRLIGAGLLALLLALTGCSNPLSERLDGSPETGSAGNLVIQLGDLDARTLGPIAGDIAGLTYRLVLQDYNQIIEQDVDFSQAVVRSIEQGSWTVGVYAYTGEDAQTVAWGRENNVSVLAGETKTVSITLQPFTERDAPGKFDYAIDFPTTADFGYYSATLKLTPSYPNDASPNPVEINLLDTGKKADVLELPAGRYTLDLSLISSRGINGEPLKVTRKETVYLYPDLTTQARYAFTEADFAADVYLQGWAFVYNYGSVEYTPTEVQLKLDGWDWDNTKIETAPITDNSWNLLVPSEAIGGGYSDVSSVQLRFKVVNGDQSLLSNWETVFLNDIQGNSWVSLSTTVYSIAKDQDNPFLNRVEGVYGIAYNRDAIAGSWVTLKIVPQSSYGIVGNSVRDNNWNFIYPDQGGTISFTMPFNNVRGFADCFHLTGTAAISGQTFGYQLARIEAYEEQNDYIWKQIGSAVTIPANGQWTIPVPEGYVYDGTGKIYFKVFSQAQGQPNQDFVITEYVSNLIDNKTVTLNVPLFTVSNFRVQSTTPSSVTLAWDPASWATGGYRVYRQDYSWNDWELRTPVELTATSYTIDGSGIYSYAVVGLYGTPATEGQKAVLENVLPGFTAPSNVSATVDRNNPLQVNVSWASVPNADSYYVYRDGIYVYSGYYSTSWTDNTGYALLGSEHSYTIKARNSSYDKESDFSVPALVNLPIADIGVNNRYYGTISAPGEFNYYRVTVSNWGDYRVYLTDRDSGIDAYVDAYVHVYVNGSWNTFDSGSVSLYLSPGTEVIVAVRSLSGTSTGSYEVSIQQY